MKERPILFNAPMVRAILEGRKTQTRRVINPQPFIDKMGNFCWNGCNFGQDSRGPHIQSIASPIPSSKTKRVHCPFGKPGDRLWVRETWNWFDPDEISEDRRGSRAPFTGCQGSRKILWVAAYAADGHLEHAHLGRALWRPSIHMPRWASRILLEITGVRVERLSDISEEDAAAEGIYNDGDVIPFNGPWFVEHHDTQGYSKASDCYCALWEKINGAGSWMTNPWVWVVQFKQLKGGAA